MIFHGAVGATVGDGPGSLAGSTTFTFPDAIPAGAVLVVHSTASANALDDPPSTPVPDAATTDHSLADDAGTTWNKAGEHSVERWTNRPGVGLSVWWTQLETELPAGTVLTLSYGADRYARLLQVNRYSVDPGVTVDLAGAAFTGSGNVLEDQEVAIAGLDEAPYTFIGRGAINGATFGPSIYEPATPTNWTEDVAVYRNTGNAEFGMSAWGHRRDFEGSGLTYGPVGTSSNHWVMGVVAFEEIPPPPDPIDYPEGTRQFEADFGTPEHGVEDASITHRPDAIVPDPRRHICTGPGAIGNLSQGIESRRWQARVNGSAVDVRVTNAGNTSWGDWTELFTYTGAVADELAIAFNLAGYPFVALQRGANIWIRWHDGADYQFDDLGAGRNPCMVLPNFDGDGPRCQANPTVQLFALRSGVGLARWAEDDGFTTIGTSPLGILPTRFLTKAVLTEARTVDVWYADRDLAAGTYIHKRLSSVPFPSRKRRPSFSGETNTIPWYRGSLWRTAADSGSYEIRANLPDPCDEVELQCADSFPTGTQPLNEGGIWTVQNQTNDNSGAGWAAGSQAVFAVTISHGGQTMTPRAFRIRTRTTVGAITCLSPWRYWLSLPEGPDSVQTGVTATLVNCDRDAILRTPNIAGFRFEVGGVDHGCNPCDGSPTCTANVVPGYTSYFFGGWNPVSPFLWVQDYQWQARTVQNNAFNDADMGTDLAPNFSGEMRGLAWIGGVSGSGAGGTLPDVDQYPLQWPPGDY